MITLQITGTRQLGQKLNKLQSGMQGVGEKSVRKAMQEGKRIAISMAPQQSGELRSGIKRKTYTKQGQVTGILSSTVPGSFPYNLWVNETSPYKYATLARRRTPSGSWPTKATRARWPRIYTKRWLYRNTKHTGVPGYFDKTVKIMEKKFPKIAITEVKNLIIRSGFQ